MICPNCGRASAGKFCPGCGTKLNTAQPASTPGSAPNQNRNDMANQGYDNSGYSSNQGCTNAGYAQNQSYNPGYAQNQSYHSGYAPGRNAYNPPNQGAYGGFVPNQGFNPGQQVVGGYQDLSAEAAGQSPGAQLLRKHASSPLILIAAILVTLYAGAISYLCGSEILRLADFFDLFEYLDAFEKISSIADLVVCAVQIILAIWMTVSTWILFASAASVGGLKNCRAFVSFRMWVYTVFALSSLITLVVLIADKKTDSEFLYAASQLMANGATHGGLHALILLPKDDTLRVALLSLVCVFAVFRGSMLFTALSSSVRMVRYGGPLKKRMVPAAVLTLFRALLLLGGNCYVLAEYGGKLAFDGILLYAAFLTLGLATLLTSIVMFMNAAELRRMRGV